MGIDGKYKDVSSKDLMAFAERHDIPYAKKAIKDVREAILAWPDFAAAAGLSEQKSKDIFMCHT